MSEWWTYTPADLLMFAPRVYWRLIETYNLAVWPVHIAALLAGLAALALLWRGRGAVAGLPLAAAWGWVAWVFLYHRYATIHTAAPYFAAAFAVQAALLLALGRTMCHPSRTGAALFGFALLVQPLIGPLLAGRPWAQAEVFGLTPDPTAVATLGAALHATGGARWLLLVVPVLWCLVSGMTLWGLGAPDALVPPGMAVLALLLATRRPEEAAHGGRRGRR